MPSFNVWYLHVSVGLQNGKAKFCLGEILLQVICSFCLFFDIASYPCPCWGNVPFNLLGSSNYTKLVIIKYSNIKGSITIWRHWGLEELALLESVNHINVSDKILELMYSSVCGILCLQFWVIRVTINAEMSNKLSWED